MSAVRSTLQAHATGLAGWMALITLGATAGGLLLGELLALARSAAG